MVGLVFGLYALGCVLSLLRYFGEIKQDEEEYGLFRIEDIWFNLLSFISFGALTYLYFKEKRKYFFAF